VSPTAGVYAACPSSRAPKPVGTRVSSWDEITRSIRPYPNRLVWWWASADEPATRVEFLVVPAPLGTRVIVTESAPSFPIARLATSFALVAA
jgi:hypothetical protein